MSKVFNVPVPPNDADVRQVVIHMKNGSRTYLSCTDAQTQGYITFTTDPRGYVNQITSLEGNVGFPSQADSVRVVDLSPRA